MGRPANDTLRSADYYRKQLSHNIAGLKAVHRGTLEIDGESEYAASLISKQKQLTVELAEIRKGIALGYQMAREREQSDELDRKEQILERLEGLERRSKAH